MAEIIRSGFGDTALLREELRKLKLGEIATYEKLSLAVGKDARLRAGGAIRRACRSLENSIGMHFAIEPKIGIRCVGDSTAAHQVGLDVRRIRRAARRTIQKGGSIISAKLSRDEHSKFLADLGAAGTVAQATEAKTITLQTKRYADTLPLLPAN